MKKRCLKCKGNCSCKKGAVKYFTGGELLGAANGLAGGMGGLGTLADKAVVGIGGLIAPSEKQNPWLGLAGDIVGGTVNALTGNYAGLANNAIGAIGHVTDGTDGKGTPTQEMSNKQLFAMGGPMMGMMPQEQTGPNVNKFSVPTHEEGGALIAPNAEIQKNETTNGKYVFSDEKTKDMLVPGTKMSFAEKSKKFDFKDTDDDITKRTKKRELERLKAQNDIQREALFAKKQKSIANQISKLQAANPDKFPYGGNFVKDTYAETSEGGIAAGATLGPDRLNTSLNTYLSPEYKELGAMLNYKPTDRLQVSGGLQNINQYSNPIPTVGMKYTFKNGGYYTPQEVQAAYPKGKWINTDSIYGGSSYGDAIEYPLGGTLPKTPGFDGVPLVDYTKYELPDEFKTNGQLDVKKLKQFQSDYELPADGVWGKNSAEAYERTNVENDSYENTLLWDKANPETYMAFDGEYYPVRPSWLFDPLTGKYDEETAANEKKTNEGQTDTEGLIGPKNATYLKTEYDAISNALGLNNKLPSIDVANKDPYNNIQPVVSATNKPDFTFAEQSIEKSIPDYLKPEMKKGMEKFQAGMDKYGQYAPILYNAFQSAAPIDYYKATMNPEYDKAIDLMANRRYNIDPQKQAAERLYYTTRGSVDAAAGGDRAMRMQGGLAAQMRSQRALDEALAQKQNMDAQYMAQEAQMRQSLGSEKQGLLNQEELYKLKAEANRRAHLAKAAEQFGQVSGRNELVSGQKGKDVILADLLKMGYPYEAIQSLLASQGSK